MKIPEFCVVSFPFAGKDVLAVVIEDRGPLGGDGEQLCRLRAIDDVEDKPFILELPASKLTVVHKLEDYGQQFFIVLFAGVRNDFFRYVAVVQPGSKKAKRGDIGGWDSSYLARSMPCPEYPTPDILFPKEAITLAANMRKAS